jgi:hypothetical protein
LKRICGFSVWQKLPSESTFSRAFAEFAEAGLAERTHAALVKETLGEQLIGHISRDGTAIEAREKPAKKDNAPESALAVAKKRGRPRMGEVCEIKPGKLELERGKPLAELLKELPRECDRDSKCNAQDYKNSWNGYKLHIDTADCDVPISALLSSASMHDSLAAMPLSMMTAERVTNLRLDGRGVLQQRVAGTQSQLGAYAVDRSQSAQRRKNRIHAQRGAALQGTQPGRTD